MNDDVDSELLPVKQMMFLILSVIATNDVFNYRGFYHSDKMHCTSLETVRGVAIVDTHGLSTILFYYCIVSTASTSIGN